jgi:hypothetical protein
MWFSALRAVREFMIFKNFLVGLALMVGLPTTAPAWAAGGGGLLVYRSKPEGGVPAHVIDAAGSLMRATSPRGQTRGHRKLAAAMHAEGVTNQAAMILVKGAKNANKHVDELRWQGSPVPPKQRFQVASISAQAASLSARAGNPADYYYTGMFHAGKSLAAAAEDQRANPNLSTPERVKQAHTFLAAEKAYAKAGFDHRATYAHGRAVESFDAAGQHETARAIERRGPRQVQGARSSAIEAFRAVNSRHAAVLEAHPAK